MLSRYVDSGNKYWHDILPFTTCTCSTASQETTGYSPFICFMFGHPVASLTPFSLSVLTWTLLSPRVSAMLRKLVAQLSFLLWSHSCAPRSSTIHGMRICRTRRVTHHSFGHLCNRGLCHKIVVRYTGPFVVTDNLSGMTTRLLVSCLVAAVPKTQLDDVARLT